MFVCLHQLTQLLILRSLVLCLERDPVHGLILTNGFDKLYVSAGVHAHCLRVLECLAQLKGWHGGHRDSLVVAVAELALFHGYLGVAVAEVCVVLFLVS